MPIKMQPEPAHFFEKVSKPGAEFLAKNPDARGRKLKTCWRAIIPDLYDAYSGICAYTSYWVSFDTGWKTAEHFKPKEIYPQLAYCWDNYRFVCGTFNGKKGRYEDVLDPFTLQYGWFTIDFPSLLLKPGQHLTIDEATRVKKTIKRLDLNGSTGVRGRMQWLTPYLQGRYGLDHLLDKAPFLAYELKQQNLVDIYLPIWDAFRKPNH